MSDETFGSYVAGRRKALGLSQKELAALVLREEDQKPISPQYLNDIERDRRQPTSDYLIKQFSTALRLNDDDAIYMFYLAGTIPNEFKGLPKEKATAAFMAFRRGGNK